jgi:hypothetical protein
MLYQTNVFLAVLGNGKAIYARTRRMRVDSERTGSFLSDCTSANPPTNLMKEFGSGRG